LGKTGRAGEKRDDSQNITASTGQTEWNRQNRIGKMGKAEWDG
jgi:hypothetical protein